MRRCLVTQNTQGLFITESSQHLITLANENKVCDFEENVLERVIHHCYALVMARCMSTPHLTNDKQERKA